jgi:tetratricopeptide (TPR) repeat protein
MLSRLRGMAYIGFAKLCLAEYHEAVVWLRRSIAGNPNFPSAYIVVAAALAMLGLTTEAKATVQTVLSLTPDWTVSLARAASTYSAATQPIVYLLIAWPMLCEKPGVPEG